MAVWQEDPYVRANLRRARRIRKSWNGTMRRHKLYVVDDVPTFGERVGGGLRETDKSPRPRYIVPPIERMYADEHGVTIRVEAVDNIGAAEFRKVAKKLSDKWKMRDLQITDLVETAPGYFELSVIFTDPLTIVDKMTVAPLRLSTLEYIPLGLGSSGEIERLMLAQGAGISMAGASGFGKSKCLQYLITRLAPSPEVQIVTANGKVTEALAGDFRAFAARISHMVGSDVFEVHALLMGLKAEMDRRNSQMFKWWGVDQFWEHGPTVDVPLIVAILDECQAYLNPDNAELVEALVKMGRSSGIVVILATQKSTGDAIPTAIRDVCTSAIAFPVRSRAQETAALGEEINDYPDFSPRKILRRKYRGVGTMLSEGAEGYIRFRVPLVDLKKVCEPLCLATAKYVRDIPGLEGVGTGHRYYTPPKPKAPADKPDSAGKGGRPRGRGTRPSRSHRPNLRDRGTNGANGSTKRRADGAFDV